MRNVLNSRNLAVLAFVAAASTSVFAQGMDHGLRVGLLAGANYNYVDAPMQEFVQVPGSINFGLKDFSKASAFEVFYGVMGEYLFNDQIGVTLRATVDARCVEKEDNGSTFTPRLVYISFDPGVRVNLGIPELYAIVGGTVAVKGSAQYDYKPGSVEAAQDITDADLNNVHDVAFGAWAGFGYDFRLNDRRSSVGLFVTPFVEGSYLFDQKDPDVSLAEDKLWNTLTARAGVQFKAQF